MLRRTQHVISLPVWVLDMIAKMRARLAGVVARPLASAAMRRFVHDQNGASAVEFAMVAAPFLALIFAILQTALVFFASQVLETAGADSARLIMTGQAQTKGWSQTAFKDAVCARIYGLFDCAGGLYVDVKTYSAFGSINNSQLPVDASGNLQTGSFTYQPGGPGDIVVVRLIYQWPVYLSLLGFNLSNAAAGSRVLMSTVAFRNEPYGGAS